MAEEGASPRELIMEAARRDNEELINEVLSTLSSEDKIADLLNNARDGMGLTALHNGAKYGAYNVLDIILDQPMVETDPLVASNGASPLHLAVEYANTLPPAERQNGLAIVELLLDAGCDPRLKNKDGRKPLDLVDVRNGELVQALRKGEMVQNAGPDIVDEDGDDEDAGPPSDSD